MSPTTEFFPTNHGYPFVNRFEKNWPNIFIRTLVGNSIYGLCGGMVFSAYDYFLHKVQIPNIPEETVSREQFIRYLWKRQLNSMPVKNYLSLLRRNFQKDQKLLLDTISRQLPLVTAAIDRKKAMPLVIIRSKKFENLTNNHQLLVCGYELEGSLTRLICYDPNHPLEAPHLTIERDISALSISQSTGEEIRGFFCNQYTPKEPY